MTIPMSVFSWVPAILAANQHSSQALFSFLCHKSSFFKFLQRVHLLDREWHDTCLTQV